MTDYGGTQLRGRLIDCFVAPEHLDTRDQSRCQVVPNSWAQENSQQGIWKTSHCTVVKMDIRFCEVGRYNSTLWAVFVNLLT